ncbi:MAG: putative DNA binding domain-containing protein [Gammaproteobacteria bacterium]|nr:putative DNA binding domain-containing protein [Gammaproteobacteria bacterium]
MNSKELLAIIARDEDSKHQFKANVTNEISLAAEMVAFSNTQGGRLIIGVADDGSIAGLNRDDMGRLSNLVSNVASQHVKPPINPLTENIALADGLVMVVTIEPGIAKPYMDKNGVIWVKSGADKRKATAREEIQRMYQAAHLVHGDEVPVINMSADDIDERLFSAFYEKQFEEPLDEQSLALPQLLQNLNLAKEGVLNIAGALLFGRNVQYRLPAFIVKCVTYPGVDINEDEYLDSQDVVGTLRAVFDDTLGFVLRHIKRVQGAQGVNSLGELEIPKVVFEELIANALIHRDYFVSAPVRLFVFSDRIEIISPGHLPNNLTIENIKNGNSNIRNPILASFATKLLPYRGLGSGIRRAIKAYPDTDFEEDREGNLFKATIRLPAGSAGEQMQGVESGVESRVESGVALQILELLSVQTLSKAEIARALGKAKPTRYLNDLMKKMIQLRQVEYTVPDKPNSRLQKYRLVNK